MESRIYQEIIAQTAQQIMAEMSQAGVSVVRENEPSLFDTQSQHLASFRIPVGISNRHIHLSRTDLYCLFGPGYNLTRMKAVKQPGQFAAEETVTLRTDKGEIKKVRILGPIRKETQIELSVADGFILGIKPPIRLSGDLKNTPGVEIIGPLGRVKKDAGVIVAWSHIHMTPDKAQELGLMDGEHVNVAIEGERGGVLNHVVVRVAQASITELHVDIEEANAFGLRNDDQVCIQTFR